MQNWLCAPYTQLMVWMMPHKKTENPETESKLRKLMREIDVLHTKYQNTVKEFDNAFHTDFETLLHNIAAAYPDTDILCFSVPKDRAPFYLNGILKDEQEEDPRIRDSFELVKTACIAQDIVISTEDNTQQITTEGEFLTIPLFNQKMRIQGCLVFHARGDQTTDETEIRKRHALAVTLSALIKEQTATHLMSADAKKKQPLAKKNAPLELDSTVSYRREREKTIFNYTPSSTHLMGIAFGDGIGIGNAVIHGSPQNIVQYTHDSAEEDMTLLHQALKQLAENIDDTRERQGRLLPQEALDCLDMHKLLLQDRMWIEHIEDGIQFGLSLSAAIEYARQRLFFTLSKIADPYIRDRFADIDDLSDQLRLHLENADIEEVQNEQIIIVAHSLGVSSLMEYNTDNIKGIILETGSISSHIAIIAGSMDVPILGQCSEALEYINPGDRLIIDSAQSVAFVLPEPHTLRLYKRKKAQIQQRERYRSLISKQSNDRAVTLDGTEVSLYMNAGLLSDISLIEDYGAEGIGLFRTELTFMGWTRYPVVKKQVEMYQTVLGQIGKDKPIVFRTLDIGGDKPLPYFDAPEEENPALGWRAVRIGIDRPAILRTQLTAFLTAAGNLDVPLYVMLPLVTEVAEIIHVKELLTMTAQRLEKSGQAVPKDTKLGVMVEVPSLLWQMDEVCDAVDFVSVGTNDLMQYLYAADRGSALMHNRYDFLSQPMLRVMKHIAETCEKHSTPVHICGEAASQPLEAMVLLALGYTNLSMPVSRIPLIRNMCRNLDIPALKPYIEKLMQSDVHSLRIELTAFAKDHDISLG